MRTYSGLPDLLTSTEEEPTPRHLTRAASVEEEQNEQQSKRVQIALQGAEEGEQMRAHPLASYARELIQYSLGDTLSPQRGLSPEGVEALQKALEPLREDAENMDGMVALREMYKTKIQSASRAHDAKSELDRLRDEILKETYNDRALVLHLIKAYREVKAPGGDEEAVKLMEASAKLQDVGLGDHRVQILVEGAQALKKLGTDAAKSDLPKAIEYLQQATKILDGCVELVPNDETFGVLGGIHKKLKGLFEKKGDKISTQTHFLRASDSYRKGARVDPEKYYCGINWAMLLREQIQAEENSHMKETLQVRFDDLIPRLCVALGKCAALEPTLHHSKLMEEYWQVATAVELAAQTQEWAMGKSAMMVLLKVVREMPVNDSWMISSTFEQLPNVLSDLQKDEIQVDAVFRWWVDFYCQIFDQNLTERKKFHVLHDDTKAPAILEIGDNTFEHSRVSLSGEEGDAEISRVQLLVLGALETKKDDARWLRINYMVGDNKPISVLFPNEALRIHFSNNLSNAKGKHRSRMMCRESENYSHIDEVDHADPGQQGAEGAPSVEIDEHDLSLRNRQRKVLGMGTFASVYQATNKITGKQIAVKVMDAKKLLNMSNEDGIRYDHLFQEIRTMSQLQHKNIVRYLGCQKGKKATDFYIFMEHMVGGSLKDLLQNKGALDDKLIARYTHDMLQAMSYLHSNSITHRDIKAANVLLDENLTTAKLADFGTSLICDQKQGGDDQIGGKTGGLQGFTPAYAAPEAVRGEWSVESQCANAVDVWALGCTVITMVTSTRGEVAADAWQHAGDQMPIHKDSDDNMLQGQHLHKAEGERCWVCALQQARPPMLPQHMSPSCQAFCELCFAQDPAKRANVHRLIDSIYISTGGGVLVHEGQDQVKPNEVGLVNIKGNWHCDGLLVAEICDKLQENRLLKSSSAFMIYSQAVITRNVKRLIESLQHSRCQHILFNMESNPSEDVLKHLAFLGVHVNLSRGKHVKLAQQDGFVQSYCVVDGTARLSMNKLQAALAEHMTFKVQNLAITEHLTCRIWQIHSNLDLKNLKEAIEANETRYEAKLLVPVEKWRPLVEEARASGLFKVTGLHCHVEDPEEALVTLQSELAAVKEELNQDAPLSVCLRGLDEHNWNKPLYSRLVYEMGQISHPILEISQDLLEDAALLIDRVLQVQGSAVIVQASQTRAGANSVSRKG